MPPRAYPLLVCLLSAAFAGNASAEDSVTLRVMTFNVWYGGEQVSLVAVGDAIRAAEADIVGVQEADGNLERIAQLSKMPYVDARRRLLSRYPIFDSGGGTRTEREPAPYSITALDRDAIHAWVMVRPGKVVAVSNVHLSSDPSGFEMARAGSAVSAVEPIEQLRSSETKPLTALGKLASQGMPVFLTGDFNTPSHLDWTDSVRRARTDIPYAVQWPVTRMLAEAGLRDSFREVHPDPAKVAGNTWKPGLLHGDRIDLIFTAGKSTTVGSRILGETGGPDVEIEIRPWPSDHRAVVSTFSVVPADAPALIDVSPRIVETGKSFLVRTYDPTGPQWNAVIVRKGGTPDKAITGLRNLPNEYQRAMRFSAEGFAPGEYEALLLGKGDAILKRNAFTVVGQDAHADLRVVNAKLHSRDEIRVRWENAPGDLRDWIGLYKAGEVNVLEYLDFVYTDAHVSGEASLRAGTEKEALFPGRYELRLMRDETYVALARDFFEIIPP